MGGRSSVSVLLRRLSKTAAEVAAPAVRAQRGLANLLGLGLAWAIVVGTEGIAAAAAEEAKSDAEARSSDAAAVVAAPSTAAADQHQQEIDSSAESHNSARAAESESSEPSEPKKKRAFPVTFTPRGQIFVRGQGRFNTKFDPVGRDRDVAVLQRARLGLLAETGPVKAYVEAQDIRKWGFGGSTVADKANLDLHQGYLELGGAKAGRSASLRLGRQEIQIGSRRLMVDANWNPRGQSFDALRMVGASGMVSLDAGLMMLAPPTTFSIADPGGDPELAREVQTRGTYSAYTQLGVSLGPALTFEGLVLGISQRPTAKSPTAERDIVNGGLRMHGKAAPGLIYDVEAYGQAGRELGLKHRAWAGFATIVYTFKARIKPGLSLRYNYATGQACTGSPEEGCGNVQSGEFYRFFGLKHARYGLTDNVAHSNLREFELGAHLAPHSTVKLNLSYHFIQLDEPTGRWRRVNNTLAGAGWDPNNTRRNLGNEVDLLVIYRPWKALFMQLGYGVFMPQEAGRQIAGSASQHFVFLWMVAKL